MDHKAQIREFVISDLMYGDAGTLTDESSFLDSGLIDSTGMLELILFIERTYEVKIDPQEMTPANLDSVNRISAFLEAKLSACGNRA